MVILWQTDSQVLKGCTGKAGQKKKMYMVHYHEVPGELVKPSFSGTLGFKEIWNIHDSYYRPFVFLHENARLHFTIFSFLERPRIYYSTIQCLGIEIQQTTKTSTTFFFFGNKLIFA